MTFRRACVAAIAFAAIALLPASAGAHPADCTTAVAEAPTTDRFADWGGCGNQTSWGAQPSKRARVAHGKRGSIRQVGHEPLEGRGMNAALAIHEDYAYVGSRTDGGHGEPFGGIMVVDIEDPDDPELRGEPIDPKPGESTRELRVWSSQEVLIVLNTNCGAGPTLHHCTIDSISNIRFYDISGRNAKHPRLLNEFKVETHEFFLWQDPKNPERALIFAGNAGSTCGVRGGAPTCPFSVWDISGVPDGKAPVDALQRALPVPALPACSGTGAEADRRPALADDQQRRQSRLLRAADRRLRDRRRLRFRGRPAGRASARDHRQRVAARVGRPGRPQRGQAVGP